MPKIKALIVDDEALARDLLTNFLNDFNDIEILGECENGFQAIKAIRELQPDLIFLDVQMPKIDGFELLEVLDNPPPIIFTTAYDEYAVKAFEQNAVDYLLKPFSKERLATSIEKARLRISSHDFSGSSIQHLKQSLDIAGNKTDRIVVKKGYKIVVIPIMDIHYFEAQDDYVKIYAEQGRFLKDKTMKYYETHLPPDFIRIHRRHIVPVSQIDTIEQFGKDSHLVVLKCGAKLTASSKGYKRLREKIDY